MTIRLSSHEYRRSLSLLVIFAVAAANLHFGTIDTFWSSYHFGAPVKYHNEILQEHDIPRNDTMPERVFLKNGTIGLVHVGKTGGSTLSMQLRNGCPSYVKKRPCHDVENETIVSTLVSDYYHVTDCHHLPKTTHRAYIVTARDAYKRAVSAFLHHHPKNARLNGVKMNRRDATLGLYAYNCFDTLEDFAALMKENSTNCQYMHPQDVVNATDCAALACAAIQGRVQFFTHLFYSFQNIMNWIPTDNPPRIIFALRQEHYWEDWTNINVLLGQEDPVVIPGSHSNLRNVSALNLPVTRDISERGRLKLCEALVAEYTSYFKLLRIAHNLQESDVMDAMQIAKSNCPNLDFQAIMAGH